MKKKCYIKYINIILKLDINDILINNDIEYIEYNLFKLKKISMCKIHYINNNVNYKIIEDKYNFIIISITSHYIFIVLNHTILYFTCIFNHIIF